MELQNIFLRCFCTNVGSIPLADPEGGLRGLQPPPLNFQKKVVIRVAVVIYLVVTSSNNVCLCALNGVVIGYYSALRPSKIGIAIVHYYVVLLAGPLDKQVVFAIREKLGLTPKWMLPVRLCKWLELRWWIK